jgi:hypothetical protein
MNCIQLHTGMFYCSHSFDDEANIYLRECLYIDDAPFFSDDIANSISNVLSSCFIKHTIISFEGFDEILN